MDRKRRSCSRDYVEYEKQAAISKIGMWEGKFVAPWDWRRGIRQPPEQLETCIALALSEYATRADKCLRFGLKRTSD